VNRISRCAACGVLALLLPSFAAVRTRAQASPGGDTPAKPADRTAVLVELFTSEGCPHCPEADALLERLYTSQSIDGAQVIAIEEHVDYWDRPAWVDHYSSPAFTARQKLYVEAMDLESMYTPQMVVDGLVEFVGNNESRAHATISALGHGPKAAVRIFPPEGRPGAAAAAQPSSVRLEARGLALTSAADVFLVLAEDKLVSRVSGGSNNGESWPHSSIAHWFRMTGKLSPKDTNFTATVALEALQPAWRPENLRLIAFVQEEESRLVVAVGAARLEDVAPAAKGPAGPAVALPQPPSAPASKPPPDSSKPY